MFYFLVIILLTLVYYFLTKPNKSAQSRFAPFSNINYAHRGFHNDKYPENSMLAFKNAINFGYGIELDVQITKDNQIVVFHDYDLKRACEIDKMVDELNYDELRQYYIFDSQETIPLFQDVLKTVDGKVPLIVEIKQKGANSLTTALTAEILKTYQGNYCIESFNPMALNWYRKNQPEIIRGQLATKLEKEDASFFLRITLTRLLLNFLSRPDFVAYEHFYLNHLRIKVQRYLYKTPLVTWTLDERPTYDKLIAHNTIIFEDFEI